MARSLQQDLDNIAERADTSTPEGLHYLLTGAICFFSFSNFFVIIFVDKSSFMNYHSSFDGLSWKLLIFLVVL